MPKLENYHLLYALLGLGFVFMTQLDVKTPMSEHRRVELRNHFQKLNRKICFRQW